MLTTFDKTWAPHNGTRRSASTPKADIRVPKQNCLPQLRRASPNSADQSVTRPSIFATQAPQPNMETRRPSKPSAIVMRPRNRIMMIPMTPSALWLPKINAPPRLVMGKANSARSGLFHLLSTGEGKQDSALTSGCVRQLMSE